MLNNTNSNSLVKNVELTENNEDLQYLEHFALYNENYFVDPKISLALRTQNTQLFKTTMNS